MDPFDIWSTPSRRGKRGADNDFWTGRALGEFATGPEAFIEKKVKQFTDPVERVVKRVSDSIDEVAPKRVRRNPEEPTDGNPDEKVFEVEESGSIAATTASTVGMPPYYRRRAATSRSYSKKKSYSYGSKRRAYSGSRYGKSKFIKRRVPYRSYKKSKFINGANSHYTRNLVTLDMNSTRVLPSALKVFQGQAEDLYVNARNGVLPLTSTAIVVAGAATDTTVAASTQAVVPSANGACAWFSHPVMWSPFRIKDALEKDDATPGNQGLFHDYETEMHFCNNSTVGGTLRLWKVKIKNDQEKDGQYGNPLWCMHHGLVLDAANAAVIGNAVSDMGTCGPVLKPTDSRFFNDRFYVKGFTELQFTEGQSHTIMFRNKYALYCDEDKVKDLYGIGRHTEWVIGCWFGRLIHDAETHTSVALSKPQLDVIVNNKMRFKQNYSVQLSSTSQLIAAVPDIDHPIGGAQAVIYNPTAQDEMPNGDMA